MLKLTRRIVALIFLLGLTWLFLDFTGTAQSMLGWMAKLQLLPSILALNWVVVVTLLVITWLFGRIYCSVICPLGIMQDFISHCNKKKNHQSYSRPLTWLRYLMLTMLILSIILGIGSLAALLAPYSTFGRIVQNIFQPIYIYINNILAIFAERLDSYTFYHRDVWIRSMPTFVIAVISFIVIIIIAWRNGRTVCNTICPVGTVLGFISRHSCMKVKIDTDLCNNCHKCERNCKASCINSKEHKIDYSRCVVCGNCLKECSSNAITFSWIKKDKTRQSEKDNTGRREFLVGAGLALTTAALAQERKKVDGGLAVIEDKVEPKRNTPIVPPGAASAHNLQQHCTGCQLCISKCPNDVLRPSTDLLHIMQPTMNYERGYCRPECNICSNVCPTGAIKPITLAEKSSTQIGHAVWVKKNCIPLTDGQECGNCARHCPVGAIQMIYPNGDESKPQIPAINETKCIGCGACEYLCPARPFSAIYVEGHETHKLN